MQSPRRKRARLEAAEKQAQRAGYMQKVAARRRGRSPHPQDVVSIPIDKVDRGKLDDPSMMAVVLESSHAGRLRCGVQAGVIRQCFEPTQVRLMEAKAAEFPGLAGVYESWRAGNLPKHIALRTAAASVSAFGGQGMIRCGCAKGTCRTKACSCFAAERECNSRCHARNPRCQNQQL